MVSQHEHIILPSITSSNSWNNEWNEHVQLAIITIYQPLNSRSKSEKSTGNDLHDFLDVVIHHGECDCLNGIVFVPKWLPGLHMYDVKAVYTFSVWNCKACTANLDMHYRRTNHYYHFDHYSVLTSTVSNSLSRRHSSSLRSVDPGTAPTKWWNTYHPLSPPLKHGTFLSNFFITYGGILAQQSLFNVELLSCNKLLTRGFSQL